MLKIPKLPFLSGDKRSDKASFNIIVTFLIKGGSILVNLALVPVYVSFLDVNQYGIWITLSSIIAWFSFFDVGFGHGLRNKFAESVAKGNISLAKTYVSTTYFLLTLIIVPLWLLFYFLNSFIDWASILNTSSLPADELSKVAFTIFSFFCALFILKLLGSILAGNQQPAKASLFDFLSNAMLLCILLVYKRLYGNGTIVTLAVITGISQITILLLFSVLLFNSGLKAYKPSSKYIDLKQSKTLMGLGVKFFIIQIGAVLVFETTNIIAIRLVGPASVAIYNTCYRYFAMASMISGIVAAPFWSAFTDAYVQEDYSWMKRVVQRLNNFFIGMLVVVLLMLALSKMFFHLWLNDTIKIPFFTSVLMACNTILVIRWNLLILIINGTGKLKLQLLANMVLGLFFIPLAYILGKSFSLNGIIFANIIVNFLYAILVPIQGNRIINRTATGIWNA